MNTVWGQISHDDTVNLNIDFMDSSFVDPKILCVLAAFVERLKLGFEVSVDCLNLNDNSVDYISRMDFFKEVGFSYEETFTRRNGDGKFIPITRITEDNRYSLPGDLSRIISEQWNGIDDSVIASLDWSIAEAIDNIFNHSKTVIDGFVVAQYFPAKHKIGISIIDSGIGIPDRLKQRPIYADLSTLQALELAVEQNITVNPETNVGAGLFYTKRIIEENNGILTIHSDIAQLTVNSSGKHVCQSPKWNGTIIQLTINTNRVIDPDKIWGENVPATVTDYMEDQTLW